MFSKFTSSIQSPYADVEMTGVCVKCDNGHDMEGPVIRANGWCCDRAKKFGGPGCERGLTDFRQGDSILNYKCKKCGFYLCDYCAAKESVPSSKIPKKKRQYDFPISFLSGRKKDKAKTEDQYFLGNLPSSDEDSDEPIYKRKKKKIFACKSIRTRAILFFLIWIVIVYIGYVFFFRKGLISIPTHADIKIHDTKVKLGDTVRFKSGDGRFWDVSARSEHDVDFYFNAFWYGSEDSTFEFAQVTSANYGELSSHPSCGKQITKCMDQWGFYGYYIRASNGDCVLTMNCHNAQYSHLSAVYVENEGTVIKLKEDGNFDDLTWVVQLNDSERTMEAKASRLTVVRSAEEDKTTTTTTTTTTSSAPVRCMPDECMNGGECIAIKKPGQPMSKSCQCKDGFVGPRCAEKVGYNLVLANGCCDGPGAPGSSAKYQGPTLGAEQCRQNCDAKPDCTAYGLLHPAKSKVQCYHYFGKYGGTITNGCEKSRQKVECFQKVDTGPATKQTATTTTTTTTSTASSIVKCYLARCGCPPFLEEWCDETAVMNNNWCAESEENCVACKGEPYPSCPTKPKREFVEQRSTPIQSFFGSKANVSTKLQ